MQLQFVILLVALVLFSCTQARPASGGLILSSNGGGNVIQKRAPFLGDAGFGMTPGVPGLKDFFTKAFGRMSDFVSSFLKTFIPPKIPPIGPTPRPK